MKKIVYALMGACMLFLVQSCDKIVAKGDPGDWVYVYHEPEVALTVDDVPAEGGVVAAGVVTYSQLCTISRGDVSRDSVITQGGVVTFGSPVDVPSAGSEVYAERRKVGVLEVSVSLNGKTGTASADVMQQPNGVVLLNMTLSAFTVNVGESCTIAASAVYASGYQGACEAVYTCDTEGVLISGSQVTASKCGMNGSSYTVKGAAGGRTAEAVLYVSPLVQSLSFSGPKSYQSSETVHLNVYHLNAEVIFNLDNGTQTVDVAASDCVIVDHSDVCTAVFEKGNVYAFKPGVVTEKFRYFGQTLQVTVTIL